MNTELTDKQLERAIWMYEHRPLFVRYMLYASGALCAILVIIFFIFTVQLIFFQLQRVDFLKNSQQIILYTDPALAFQPLDLDVSEFLVVRHPQRGADFGVKVINANAKWYAFLYDFMFVVDGKQGIAQNGFALPGTTYLAGFLSKEEPFTQATIEIHNVKWKRIVPIKDEERLRLTNFDTAQTAFIAGDKISTIDRVVSTLYNNSPFGFWNVEVIDTHEAFLLDIGDRLSFEERSWIENISSTSYQKIAKYRDIMNQRDFEQK